MDSDPGRQNVVRTVKVKQQVKAECVNFCFCHILTPSVICLLNRRKMKRNLFALYHIIFKTEQWFLTFKII